MASRVSKATTRRPRAVLSRGAIAETAMRITLEQPTTPLTLARLGAELAADPTALYRHYRSRDELVRELADRLYAEVVDTAEVTDDWLESLRNVAATLRTVMLRRPALAADMGTRFTGGPHERRGVEILRDILRRAGFDEHDIPNHLRAMGEMVLAEVVMTASMLILPAHEQEFELSVGRALYGGDAGDPLTYEDTTFSWIFETYLSGLQMQLEDRPHPAEGVNMNHQQGGEQ
jgi:AcrR family transcriptional regulator